jgi:hypothetical protein
MQGFCGDFAARIFAGAGASGGKFCDRRAFYGWYTDWLLFPELLFRIEL